MLLTEPDSDFLLRDGNTALCLQIHHKNERHLRLVSHIISKFSQNVYLANAYILIYFMPDVTASSETPFDFIVFFWVFSYIFDDHSCLNCCISTKLSLIVYLINTDMSKCQMMPDDETTPHK